MKKLCGFFAFVIIYIIGASLVTYFNIPTTGVFDAFFFGGITCMIANFVERIIAKD